MKRATLVLVSAVVGCSTTQETNTSAVRNTRSVSDTAPTITEVALHYRTADGNSRILRIDPGHVDLMFFDSTSRDTYFRGVGADVPPARPVTVGTLTTTLGNFFHDSVPPNPFGGGFAALVTFRARGLWYHLSDVTTADSLVVYYQSRTGNEIYELRLPLRPSTLPPSDVRDVAVDVIFWNMPAYHAYRRGLEAKIGRLSDPANARLNGRYKSRYFRPDGTFFDSAYYMPTVSRPGAFRSADSEICYHFENCQWVCTGN